MSTTDYTQRCSLVMWTSAAQINVSAQRPSHRERERERDKILKILHTPTVMNPLQRLLGNSIFIPCWLSLHNMHSIQLASRFVSLSVEKWPLRPAAALHTSRTLGFNCTDNLSASCTPGIRRVQASVNWTADFISNACLPGLVIVTIMTWQLLPLYFKRFPGPCSLAWIFHLTVLNTLSPESQCSSVLNVCLRAQPLRPMPIILKYAQVLALKLGGDLLQD